MGRKKQEGSKADQTRRHDMYVMSGRGCFLLLFWLYPIKKSPAVIHNILTICVLCQVFQNKQIKLKHSASIHFYKYFAFLKKVSFINPTNIGITRGTTSVATLLVVSDGVDIWVALFLHHLYCIYH